MNIETLCLGPCMTNCYIVSSDGVNCAIVDPADNADIILKTVKKKGYVIDAILLTHAHYDHIGALNELTKKDECLNAPVYIHSDETVFLRDVSYNLSDSLFGIYYTYDGSFCAVDNGQVVKAAGTQFKVLHTPGHTPGSVCYVCESEKTIFTGDTLFASTVGRTDFKGGSFSELLKSVSKLAALNGDYNLYPGHNAPTTLERERKYNEFLNYEA